MSDKVNRKIKLLQALMNDSASTENEKEICKQKIELLCNTAYTNKAKEFFIEHDITSTNEILYAFIKNLYPDFFITDGENIFQIDEVALKAGNTKEEANNPFLYIFGVNGYGKKVIIHGTAYTKTNHTHKVKGNICLWGNYNTVPCDDSSWGFQDSHIDFKNSFLTPICKSILQKYNEFISPLKLSGEEQKMLQQ